MELVETAISILGAIVLALLSSLLVVTKNTKMKNRQIMEAHYISFMHDMSDYYTNQADEEARRKFANVRNEFYLVAGIETIKELEKYEASFKSVKSGVGPDLTALLNSMRRDLKMGKGKVSKIVIMK